MAPRCVANLSRTAERDPTAVGHSASQPASQSADLPRTDAGMGNADEPQVTGKRSVHIPK